MTESTIPTQSALDIPTKQILHTITSLYAYLQHEENNTVKIKKQLLDSNNDLIYLQVTLNQLSNKLSHMPHKLPIKHSLIDTNTDDICLIVKDDMKSAVLESIGQFTSHKIKLILTVSDLKKLYGTDKLKRELAVSYSMFLIDNRLTNIIKQLIGKHFLIRKKQPVPIVMNRSLKHLEHTINKALLHTYLFISKGTTIQIKIGRSSMSRQELCDNIESVIPFIHRYIPGKSNKSIQALYIKTSNSIALPLYAKLPTDLPQTTSSTHTRSTNKKLHPIDIIDSRLNKIERIMKRKYNDNAVLPLVERQKTYLDDNDVYELLVNEFNDDVVLPNKKSKKNKPNQNIADRSTYVEPVASKPIVDQSDKDSKLGPAVEKKKAINQPKSRETRKWLHSKTR